MNDGDLFLSAAKIVTEGEDEEKTNATGFFYLQDDYLYLVTNRHVVLNEAIDHRPTSLTITVHADAADLSRLEEIRLPLYDSNEPLWIEFPTTDDAASINDVKTDPSAQGFVDVALIPIRDGTFLGTYAVRPFQGEDILAQGGTLPPDAEFLIVGFPLGFHDTLHGLPLMRKAGAASSFSHPFKGHPYFLTDARMHRGTSGSPVVIRSAPPAMEEFSAWTLVGVHSSALDVSDRDPSQDERLGLNCTWYAWLLPELASQPARRPSEKTTPR